MRKSDSGNMDSSRAFDGLFGADDASFIGESWKNWGDILDPVDQKLAAVSSPRPPPAPIKSDSEPVPKARELPPQTPKPRDSNLSKLLFTPVHATPNECSFKLGLTTPGLKLKGISSTLAKEPQAAANKGSLPAKIAHEAKTGSGASLEKPQEEEAIDSLKRRQVPPTHSEKRAKIEFVPKTPARPPEKPKLFSAAPVQKPSETPKPRPEVVKSDAKIPQKVRPPAKVLEELAFIENYIATAEATKQPLPVAVAPQGEAEAVRFEECKRAIVEILSIQLEAESLATDFFTLQREVGAEELLDQAVEVLVLDC